jgi:hypothetical protein
MFEVGTFTLNGPATQDGFECTMSVACTIQLSGTGLASTNKVQVQGSGTTCGYTNDIWVSATSGVTKNPGGSPFYTGLTAAGDGSLTRYALGTATGGTPSTSLVLCWAHDSTYLFRISNAFKMSGPTFGHQQCALTEACSLQLSGVGFADSNKLMIIPSSGECGIASEAFSSIGALSGTMAVTTPVPANGLSGVYTVASSLIVADVQGNYKMCWGHDPQSGNGVADYMVEVGTFTLNGPAMQDFVCPMTVPCVIYLTGTGFASTNKVKVLAAGTACSNSAAAFSDYTGMTLDQTVTSSGGIFNRYNLGTEILGTASATPFVLCWAHDSDYVFQISSNFLMPAPDRGDQQCTLTEPCSLQLTGVGLADSNGLMIVPSTGNCGSASASFSTVDTLSGTTPVNTPAPADGLSGVYTLAPVYSRGGVHGDYKMCWSYYFANTGDYLFTVGTFTLNGPAAQTTECTLTADCIIQLTGTGLASTNRVKVLLASDICATHAAPATGYTGALLTPQPPTSTTATETVFDLGHATTGVATTALHLCWMHENSFAFSVGIFQMSGPTAVVTECMMTQACLVQLTGVGLTATNKVRIIASSGNCSAGPLDQLDITDFITGLEAATVEGYGAYEVYDLGRATGPGTRSVSAYKLCWGHNPTMDEAFEFDVGLFHLRGSQTTPHQQETPTPATH